MLKILKSHAAVVQKALIDMGRFAVGPRRPEKARYRFDDLAELVFALPQCLLGPLALRHIDVCADSLDQLAERGKHMIGGCFEVFDCSIG